LATNRQTDRRTDRQTGPLHEANLAVASGGLIRNIRIIEKYLNNSA